MINLRNVPVVKVLIPFALGSLATYTGFIQASPQKTLIISLFIWFSSLLSYRLSGRNPRIFCWVFSPLIFLIFLVAGFGVGSLDKPVSPGIPCREHVLIEGRVSDDPVLQNGRLVFGLELRMASVADSIYFCPNLVKTYMHPSAPSSPSSEPQAGEVWILSGKLFPIRNAGNPGELDYALILKRKNCWYRFYCDSIAGVHRKLEDGGGRIPGPGELRRALSKTWKGPDKNTALLKALCLGDRSGLSEDLRHSFSQAGGMHVLAVSGLHVGLIWWVLNGILSFILPGRKKIYRALLIIIILWNYAYLTGFSSSVSRSVLMFTFYAFSRIMSHRGHSVNAILVSMFILILIHPGRLTDVGFQLSYAAILSIVALNPVFTGIWHPGNRLIRWCWEATGLSFSAQLGTLPLVIFYFHQVPVYALLTNLFAVPLLSIIITVFVISAPLVLMGLLVGAANSVLMIAGGVMNSLMEIIANFPGSALGGLYFDRFTTIVLMILIALFILFLNNKGRILLYLSLLFCCILGLWLSMKSSASSLSAEVQISHFRGGSMLSLREGRVVDHYILTDDPGALVWMDRHLAEAWGARRFEGSVMLLDEKSPGGEIKGGISTSIFAGPGKWMLGNSRFRVMMLSGSFEGEEMELLSDLDYDILLLSGEPGFFGKAIPFKFRNIVVDGSSRAWYSRELGEKGICFYNTASQGAFLLHD